jgi:Domain of unknown function (DUF4129)
MLRKFSLCALFLVTVPVCSLARAPSSDSAPSVVELDLQSYQAELTRCVEAVHNSREIPQLRRSLPRTWRVRTGQSDLDLSTEWLVADLRRIEQSPTSAPAAAREIRQRLTALRDAAKELESAGNVARLEDARKRRDEILQRREFAGATGPSQIQVLLGRIERWIVERLLWIFTRLHLGTKASNALAWTAVVVAFLVLAYWIGKNLLRATREHGTAPAAALPGEESPLWAKDALAAADRGDYREAVHCAYWASVVHLESLGLLKRDRARTPRESLRLLEPHPKEQKVLADFTRHFELIWYGYRPASQQDWSGARAHLESIGCLSSSTLATANS